MLRENTVMIVFIALCVLMSAALYLTFLWVPNEQTMGVIQRIFYFHVPSAWAAMLAFTLVFAGSILYLIRRDAYWDWIAGASAEIGLLFCTIVLITGPIWARPVWGIWWTWDARLTLTLVMWLIYAGYWILRRQIEEPEKRARFSAVIGIIAFLDIPMVYFSIHWWRTQHPSSLFTGGAQSGLDPAMLLTLMAALIAFLLLFAILLHIRVVAEKIGDQANQCAFRLNRLRNRIYSD